LQYFIYETAEDNYQYKSNQKEYIFNIYYQEMLGFLCFVEAKNTFTISNLFILSQHAVVVNLLLQKNLKKKI